MCLGGLGNMWLPRWWRSRHSCFCLVGCGCLTFLVLCWRHLLHVDHRQSLGHGHGRVWVWVEEFFVEWRKQDIDCFWVELLEGLKLFSVECAQGWQRWDSADQLPDKRERWSRMRKFKCRWGQGYKSVFVLLLLLCFFPLNHPSFLPKEILSSCLISLLVLAYRFMHFRLLCRSKFSHHRFQPYLGQCIFIHVVLLHNVLQRKVDLLLELLNFPRLHQPRSIWKKNRLF